LLIVATILIVPLILSANKGGEIVQPTRKSAVLSKHDSETADKGGSVVAGIKVKGKGSPNAKSAVFSGEVKVGSTKKEQGPQMLVLEDEDGEEVEGEEVEIEDGIEEEENVVLEAGLEEEEVVIKSNGIRARTNFPLTVNSETNELTVSTPAGTKVVAILPDVAIANMIRVGIIDSFVPATEGSGDEDEEEATGSGDLEGTTEPSPSGEPEEGATPSSTPESTSETTGLELVMTEGGTLVYEFDGTVDKKLLGIFDVKVKRKLQVSAENGELVRIQRNFGSWLLEVFSF
jgi:hypothetical protein